MAEIVLQTTTSPLGRLKKWWLHFRRAVVSSIFLYTMPYSTHPVHHTWTNAEVTTSFEYSGQVGKITLIQKVKEVGIQLTFCCELFNKVKKWGLPMFGYS